MEAGQGSFTSPSRRGFLKWAAIGLAGGALLAALGNLLSGSRQRGANAELPGEGSIFQPRKDARLEEWLRKHGNK